MHRAPLLSLLLALPALAGELTLDSKLYAQALQDANAKLAQQEKNKAKSCPAVPKPLEAQPFPATAWQNCMAAMSSGNIQAKLHATLRLLDHFKAANPQIEESRLEELHDIHLKALNDDAEACLHIGLALLEGKLQGINWPQDSKLARTWLHKALELTQHP